MAATTIVGGAARAPSAARRVAAIRIAIAAAVVVLWEAASASGLFYRDVIPSLIAIGRALGILAVNPDFYRHLAVSLAVVSSLTDRAIPAKIAVFGEIGLAGEVRPAPRGQERLKEIAKLGFGKAIVPRANLPKGRIENLEVIAVDRIDQAVARLREL